MGRGGGGCYKTGSVKICPYENGGVEKVLAMLRGGGGGGGSASFGVDFTR